MTLPIRIALLSAILTFPVLICQAEIHETISLNDDYVNKWHQTGRFHGILLITEKDKIPFEKGYGHANREWKVPCTPDMKFDIGSISKQFTTMMIFQLTEEGKIKLTDAISEFLPDYRKDT